MDPMNRTDQFFDLALESSKGPIDCFKHIHIRLVFAAGVRYSQNWRLRRAQVIQLPPNERAQVPGIFSQCRLSLVRPPSTN